MSPNWRSRIVGQGEVDPTTLKANPLNWRRHPLVQKRAIGGVLDEIGWVQQVIVNRQTGRLVDGHLRVEAACIRNESVVPVLYVELSESEEATVLATLDPLAALAQSDSTVLSELLKKTQTADAAVEALLASVAKGAGVSLLEPAERLTEPDDAPSLRPSIVSRPGDLWMLDGHRLLCGDSSSADDVERAVGEAEITWIWTDPPYGVEYVGGTSERLTIPNDHPGQVRDLLRSVFSSIDPHIADGAPIYIAHPSASLSMPFIQAFSEAGWHLHEELIWVKDHMVIGRSDYHYRHEPILYGWKGKNRTWIAGRDQSTVFEFPRPSRSPEHPSMKPVALIEKHIENSSLRGSLGLDPLAGSGSTLIAAERTGRNCVAIELDPGYVDVIVRRWQKHTGQSAVLESDERTFKQILEVRHGG